MRYDMTNVLNIIDLICLKWCMILWNDVIVFKYNIYECYTHIKIRGQKSGMICEPILNLCIN